MTVGKNCFEQQKAGLDWAGCVCGGGMFWLVQLVALVWALQKVDFDGAVVGDDYAHVATQPGVGAGGVGGGEHCRAAGGYLLETFGAVAALLLGGGSGAQLRLGALLRFDGRAQAFDLLLVAVIVHCAGHIGGVGAAQGGLVAGYSGGVIRLPIVSKKSAVVMSNTINAFVMGLSYRHLSY